MLIHFFSTFSKKEFSTYQYVALLTSHNSTKQTKMTTFSILQLSKQNNKTVSIKKKKVSYVRLDHSIVFLASGDVKILFPKFLINLNITIRPLLHTKALI